MNEHLSQRGNPKPGHNLASDCLFTGPTPRPKQNTVQLDGLERLPFLSEDRTIRAAAASTFETDIEALMVEGARGVCARKILAVEIATTKVSMKKLQSLLVIELNRFLNNQGTTESRIRLLEFLADRAFRRLASALDLLARLDPSTASLRISAVGEVDDVADEID